MASVERTARMLSPSPLMFSRRACAVSLMCLCSTHVWLLSALGLKAATRRLSCTSRCCKGLHRAPRVGARRIRCKCWQPLPSGCQRSHPVWQDFYNSGERPPLGDIRISWRSSSCALSNGVHVQACVASRSLVFACATYSVGVEKYACVDAFLFRLRVRGWWACAPLERANSGLSNGIAVCGGPVSSWDPEIMGR